MTLVYPGSFAPFTRGHHAIVMRAVTFTDRLVVAVGKNSVKESFVAPLAERVETIRRLYVAIPRIEVVACEDMLMSDFVRSLGNDAVILRGIRSFSDFEYEQTVAEVNRRLNGVETLFLFAEPAYAHISSSVIRELLRYGKDVSDYLPG
ncbi:MAG: pantetheine-phosphate adenylyltransferase [Tannerellaceae bacterium]|jgi:pantetheine-phosphate adenylyltransferase|nr:pantetheine-phosphate adenylyltransferase [Tannerellaceae bacterium]